MNPTNCKPTDVVAPPAEGVNVGGAAPEYRSPGRFPVGEAVDLLRRDGSGHLIDGTGGWWVWGS